MSIEFNSTHKNNRILPTTDKFRRYTWAHKTHLRWCVNLVLPHHQQTQQMTGHLYNDTSQIKVNHPCSSIMYFKWPIIVFKKFFSFRFVCLRLYTVMPIHFLWTENPTNRPSSKKNKVVKMFTQSNSYSLISNIT